LETEVPGNGDPEVRVAVVVPVVVDVHAVRVELDVHAVAVGRNLSASIFGHRTLRFTDLRPYVLFDLYLIWE